MFIPIGVDIYRAKRPRAVIWLIGINVLAFFVFRPVHGYLPGVLVPAHFSVFQLWTHAFLHADLMHLVGNMIFLWVFGSAINSVLGDKRFAIGYLLACPAAAFAQMAVMPAYVPGSGQPPYMLGASGAVFAVAGIFFVLMPAVKVRVLYWFFFIGTMRVPGFWFVGAYAVFNFLMVVSKSSDDTAYMAHLGGFGFGVGAAWLFIKLGYIPRSGVDIFSYLGIGRRLRHIRTVTEAAMGDMNTDAENPGVWSRGFRVQDTSNERTLVERIEHELEGALNFGDNDLAIRLYDRLQREHPEHPVRAVNMLQVGEALVHAKEFKRAMEIFLSHIRTYPRDHHRVQCEYNLGMVYAVYLDEPVLARQFLGQALHLGLDERRESQARQQLEQLESASPAGQNPLDEGPLDDSQ